MLAAATHRSPRQKPISHVAPIAFVPRGKAAVSRTYLKAAEQYQGRA